MRSSIEVAGLLAGALLAVSAGTTHGQSADPCTLFPGTPALIEKPTPQICVASYWQRVAQKHFGGLAEFGATFAIENNGSPAAAAQKLAKVAAAPGWTPSSYGDGGVEKLENSSMVDERTPTPEEVKDNTRHGSLRDLLEDKGTYAAIFSCGSNVIYVYGNPSKGPAARQLIGDFENNLKSRNICGASAPSPVSTPAPVQPAPVTPTTPVDESGSGGGTRYFDGQVATDIMNAQANGARYMAVLSRSYDNAQGCFVEERAWVSTVRASSASRVGAVVGPSITVCVKGAVLDQAAINRAEVNLEKSRNQLATALQKRAEFEAYLNDPKYAAWAKGEIAKIDTYINSYNNYISQTQATLAASVPPVTR